MRFCHLTHKGDNGLAPLIQDLVLFPSSEKHGQVLLLQLPSLALGELLHWIDQFPF